MRILQLITLRQRRGAEVFAAQLSDALAARGHDVLLLGLYSPPEPPLEPETASSGDIGGRNVRPLNPRLVIETARAIRAFAPDVVQANGSDTLKYGALARRLSSASWALVYRNISIASKWIRGPAQRLWNGWLLRSVDHVVAIGAEAHDDFRVTYGTPAARITIIPNGTALPRSPNRDTARRRLEQVLGFPLSGPVVAHVASFSPEKNHRWLLAVWARVIERFPDAQLLLIGDGPLHGVVAQEVSALGLAETIRLLGSRGDVGDLITGADLFVLPSVIEGIPGAVLEAAARCVPTVASAVGGLHETVDHGRTGLLVPVHDADAFVGAVCDLLGDSDRRRAMGCAARELVRERFELGSVVNAFEALYARVTRLGRRATIQRNPGAP